MDDSSRTEGAAASVACDPTNYDWNELDKDVPASRIRRQNSIVDAIASAPGLVDIANGAVSKWHSGVYSDPYSGGAPANATDRLTSNSDTLHPERRRATDKEVIDFVHAEFAYQTMTRLSNEFIPIAEEDADTLIHIGAPPKLPSQSDHEYSYICRQFDRPYLLRSETLRNLDSAKFKDLLGPRSARTQRRLQKAGVHKRIPNPQIIKYYIDLTPNIHDDEGMILLTELSAPQGALAWHQNASRFGVNHSQVCGRDSLDPPSKPIYRSQSQDESGFDLEDELQQGKSSDAMVPLNEASKRGKKLADDKVDNAQSGAKGALPQEDDYSQLRHYTAIARLLHAITGQDPRLNSAPKVWTFCMLAKFFDCAKTNLVSRWVSDWLVESNNLNFIQVNPSTTYRLGTAIEAVWLVKASFSIMVGQKAFSSTAYGLNEPCTFPFESASVVTEDLDDDEINRVDHAVSALVQRVKDNLNELLRMDGKWLTQYKPNSELSKLYALELKDPKGQSALETVKSFLKHYVQRLLCSALIESDYSKNPKDSLKPGPKILRLYDEIPPSVRPLTIQFWESLQKEDFSVDLLDDAVQPVNNKVWGRALMTLVKDGVIPPELVAIPYVSKTEFARAVDQLNQSRFLPNVQNIGASPEKKVEFSPPIAKESTPLFSQSSLSEQSTVGAFMGPAAKPTESSAEEIRDTGIQRSYSWESDSDWDMDVGSKETVHDSEGDGWEDVLRNLESQPMLTVPIQDLPIRQKNSIFQLTSAQPSVQVNAENAAGQLEKFSSSEPGHGEKSDNIRHCNTNQYGSTYGNPSSPQPGYAFSTFHLDDISTHRRPMKSDSKCRACVIRRIKCDKTYPSCGQCSRRGFVCDHDFGIPDGNNFRNDSVNRFPAKADGVFSSLSERTPLPENIYRAISAKDLYRQDQPLVHPSRLRVTNPDIIAPAAFPTVPPESPPPHFSFHFYISRLLVEVSNCITRFVKPLGIPGYVADDSCAYEIPVNEVGALICLTQDEYKYLPLWAGGCDDGTGGVFDDGDDIPEAPEVEYGGFRGGGMGIIPGVGSTIGGSMAGSEFEEIMTEVGVSTVGKASRIATDGEDTVMSFDD